MELTPERKLQIENEEKLRVAEEQYREQVRASLKPQTCAPVTALDSTPGHPKRQVGLIFTVISIVVTIALIAFAFGSNKSDDGTAGAGKGSRATSAPRIRYVPTTQSIASGQVVVRASGYVQYKIQVTPEMREASISGNFNASGGAGNDVTAVITSESEYENWINGHEARAYYSSHGKKTTDSFDLRLVPGTYIFAISNKFSAFSDKYVFLNVDLKYSRMETD